MRFGTIRENIFPDMKEPLETQCFQGVPVVDDTRLELKNVHVSSYRAIPQRVENTRFFTFLCFNAYRLITAHFMRLREKKGNISLSSVEYVSFFHLMLNQEREE